MKNDFNLLPLANLTDQYFQRYSELAEEKRQTLAKSGRIKHEAQVENMIYPLSRDLESSEGIEEQVRESIGEYSEDKVVLGVSQLALVGDQAKQEVIPAFFERYGLAQKSTWLPEQMLAYFGSWKAVKVGDKFSPVATLNRNTKEVGDKFAMGASLIAKADRSLFFKGAPKGVVQYRSAINPLVPIILAGFKKYQDIPYEAWDFNELHHLLDKALAQLLPFHGGDQAAESLEASKIAALRNTALTDKTGPRAGIMNNPATCTKLNHLQESAIGHLPKLAKYMVLQTWCAHPQNRTKFAVLDFTDWDRVPEPLVTAELFGTQAAPSPTVSAKQSPTYADMPWI